MVTFKAGVEVRKIEPNYVVKIELSNGSTKEYRYYIPPITAARTIKMRIEAEKLANSTKGVTTMDAYNWELAGLAFKGVVNMDELSMFDVVDKYNLSAENQQELISEAFKVAQGGKSSNNE